MEKMKVELRSGGVHISGYVNAVDRYSRPMRANDGRIFIEKILPGAFKRAIEKAENIKVKHNHKRVITDLRSGQITLKEDNIGLYCEGFFTDEEIVERAKNKELVGWSFGFLPDKYSDSDSSQFGIDFERSIDELNLNEVSIIDKRQLPCYVGTSIEVRSEENTDVSFRANTGDCEYTEEKKTDYSLKRKRLNLMKDSV